jgi:hypothetical protein
MSNNNILKGVFLVGLGATSYGMLATFVKLAYKEDFTTAEVTTAQFVYGIIGMLLINLFQKTRNKNQVVKATSKNIFQLMLAGTSLGKEDSTYGSYSDDQLIRGQKFHQRNRDLSAFITAGIYLFNIIDANVDAHLMQFNVNDNLSLKPDLNQNEIDNNFNYGVKLTYNF